jgi:parallel beta-helix repeat protein
MYWGIKLNRLAILLVVFLLITLGSGIGAAAEVYVQPGESIQTALDNAVSGDVIILKPGIYTENIKIDKNNLVISSESGNPDDTIITAKSSDNHVISLQANNVKISGLEITGTKNSYAGIYLSECNNCIIENNKILNNGYGIYLLNSKGNKLSNNVIVNNEENGILLSISANNTIFGNTASDNKDTGIHISTSDGNTLTGNNISSNDVYGLFVCPESDDNLIYNNYFNNTVNAEIQNGVGNAYNTAKTEGGNIVGGSYLGGNFWAEPEGTGFSDTAVDADGDGIADSEYRISQSIYSDQLPLISSSKPQQPGPPVANFKMNNSDGSAPLPVQFTDLSENTDSWGWDFESDGKIDSTEENPVHVFTTIGTYTVTLSATNKNGTDSKTAAVIVTHPVENSSVNNTSEDPETIENSTSANESSDNITNAGLDSQSGSGAVNLNGENNAGINTSGANFNGENDSGTNTSSSNLNTSNSNLNGENNAGINTSSVNLNGEDNTGINTSSVEYALENKTDAPGFEIVYGAVSLLAVVFLYRKVKPGN